MPTATLHHLDLAGGIPLPDASCDGCLCDPPYHLTQLSRGGSPRTNNPTTPYGRTRLGSAGFMGKTWDGGDIAFRPEVWAEAQRVLRPGAYLLAAGSSRTFHRLAVAIEDAGFTICDTITWHHGQGFPKNLDLSKAIDKAAGADRAVIGSRQEHDIRRPKGGGDERLMTSRGDRETTTVSVTAPATEAAQLWDGYGTALKPATEFYVLARKPLEGTFAANALRHGVGGLNIAGSRIEVSDAAYARNCSGDRGHAGTREHGEATDLRPGGGTASSGRWPSNLILSHSPDCLAEHTEHQRGYDHGTRSWSITSREVEARCAPGCPVAELDRQSGELQSGAMAAGTKREGIGWNGGLGCEVRNSFEGSTGGASRFFYVAKVAPGERGDCKHPTLKPVDLCRYLAKLILPPPRPDAPRRLLVPFSGAGSEIIGALRAGWEEAIGFELEAQSIADAERRIRADAPLLNVVEVVEVAA